MIGDLETDTAAADAHTRPPLSDATISMFGYRGVQWHRTNRRFMAQIGGWKTRQYLGSYATVEEAAMAYDQAARKRYGPDAFLNFPMPGERSIKAIEPGGRSECRHGHDLEIHGFRNLKGNLRCRACDTAAQARYARRKQK